MIFVSSFSFVDTSCPTVDSWNDYYDNDYDEGFNYENNV